MRHLAVLSLFSSVILTSASLLSASLSLTQANNAAQEKDPALMIAVAARDQARDRRLAALSAFLPKLNLSAGLNRNGPYDPLTVPLGEASGGRSSNSLGLSASQNLFRGFADTTTVDQASAALESAEEDLRLARAKSAYTASAAWAQLLFAQDQRALSDDTAKRRSDNVSLVQLRFDAGRENKGALLQARAQGVQAKADARRAGRELTAARRALAKAMGQAKDADLKAAGPLPLPEAPSLQDEDSVLAQVPSVRKGQLSLRQAQATSRANLADWLPALNASASLNRSDETWVPQQGSWGLGASLSWNLFNGFSDLAGQHADRQAVKAQQAALEDTLAQASLDLHNASDSLEDDLDQLEVRAAFLRASETRALIARAQYTQGLIGFEDWDRIESELINSRIAALSSRLNASLAGFAWQKALTQGWAP